MADQPREREKIGNMSLRFPSLFVFCFIYSFNNQSRYSALPSPAQILLVEVMKAACDSSCVSL